MTKERFTELLNLYLDDEISSEEEVEFRRELKFNPERYKLYLDYCKLHNACVAVGENFVAMPRQRRSARQVLYAVSGMAAAVALLALAGQNLLPMFDDEPVVQKAQLEEVILAEKSAPPVFEIDKVLGPSFRIAEGSESVAQLVNASVFDRDSLYFFKAGPEKRQAADENLPWKKGLALNADPSIESLDHELLLTVDNPMRFEADRARVLARTTFGGLSEEFQFDYSRASVGDPRDFNVKLTPSSSK